MKQRSPIETWAERTLTRKAHWFFAYTQGGARAVIANGYPAPRVTVVENSIDTIELRRARLNLTPGVEHRLRARLNLGDSRVGVFVGALDEPKRLGFLLDAVRRIRKRIPDFVLLAAGDGPLRSTVQGRSGIGVRWLGRVDTAAKAEIASVGEVLVMPGSVGLVALDSFALELPIVTTAWPYHGPEFEYLTDGVNAVVAPDDTRAFADAVVNLLRDERRLAHLRRGCTASAERFTLEAMTHNFAAGVRAALSADRC